MKPTGSRFELAMKCVGAFTLPQSRGTNKYAEDGKRRHADREDAINRGEIPVELEEAWPGYKWKAEVAFAYDVATGEGRVIGEGKNRDYGELSPFEFAGTADAVGFNGTHVVIVDWKGFEEQTRAERNPQVRFLALAACRAYRVSTADVGVLPEVGKLDRASFDAFDLAVIHDDVKTTVLAVAKARRDARAGLEVPFNTGRQCRWCDGFDACPRQFELRSLVVTGEMSMRVEKSMPYESDDEAAQAYDLWKRIGVLHKRIGESVYARAAERPIPLPDGRMFGKVQTQGNEKLDGDGTYDVMRKRFGQETADLAVERKATKKALQTAIKSVAPRGSAAEVERSVLEELREAGYATREPGEKWEEFQPRLKMVNEASSDHHSEPNPIARALR